MKWGEAVGGILLSAWLVFLSASAIAVSFRNLIPAFKQQLFMTGDTSVEISLLNNTRLLDFFTGHRDAAFKSCKYLINSIFSSAIALLSGSRSSE